MEGDGSSPPQTTNPQPDGVLADDEGLHLRDTWRTRDVVLMPVTWMKPPSQYEASHAQQPPRLHLITQPTPPSAQSPLLYLLTPPPLAGDTSTSGDQRCGKEAPKSTNAKDNNSSTSKKATASVAGGANQGSTGDARDSAGSDSTTDTSKAHGSPKWCFVVEMNGCNDVTVMPVGNKLIVEGYDVNTAYTKMVQYVTRLPSYVTPDFLSATLVNGRLTVTQEALVDLKVDGVTQPTQQHQQEKQRAPKVGKLQQQQQQEQHQEAPKVGKQQQQQVPKVEKQQ